MKEFSIEDRQRIVHRKILTLSVKNFNARLSMVNGDNDIYSIAYRKIYKELYGSKQEIDTLNAYELRRISFVLFYTLKLMNEKLVHLQKESMDFSNGLSLSTINSIIDNAVTRTKLIFNKKVDISYTRNISPILKSFDKKLEKGYLPIKTHLSLESSEIKKERLENALARYKYCYKNLIIELQKIGITEEKDFEVLINQLNKNFYGLAFKSLIFEPKTLLDNDISASVLTDEYLRLNAFKLEEATNAIKTLNNHSFTTLKNCLASVGFIARVKYTNISGLVPEMTDGFINSFALNMQYEKINEYIIEDSEETNNLNAHN